MHEYFKKCLQLGSDSVDRKIAVEASEGLQKAQLCEQTFDSAEQNSPLIDADCQSADLDSSEHMKNSFSLWRSHLTFKSYFYLGKLEEAIGSLEKQEELIAKRVNHTPYSYGITLILIFPV
ncbi:hypothetical protein P3X46_013488 [Hevea brasiliensis]|uniref:Uncharacterized protein n=1 Tax=Hevea brasiliensis TaxID=3981 RepID=A0ABQ9M4S8_HEVBR|nr:hypothetical protein P3X46_013488 [Hevea brasiliensis]